MNIGIITSNNKKPVEVRDLTSNEIDEIRRSQNVNEGQQRIFELEQVWFPWFDKQKNQSEWQDNYKPSKDPFGQEYKNFDELKAQANIYRAELKKLKQ